MNIKPTPCIIVDIDGTVADLSHRLHYVKDGNRQWDEFFVHVDKDKPIPEIISLVNIIEYAHHVHGSEIVFVSGRSEVCRDATEDWLYQHVGDLWDALFMRPEGDYRKDTVLKQSILDDIKDCGYDPWLAIDDRTDIARMWRDNGIVALVCDDWMEHTKPFREPTLHVLVGPSGAGKSTYAHSKWHNNMIVSSDDLRGEICDDPSDQSMNTQVFNAFHNIIEARLRSGLDTVADATNLRRKDRVAVTELAKGNPVIYHVINRPAEAKKATGSWRLDVPNLIERHEQRFQSQKKDILRGDGYDNVKVEVVNVSED